MHRCLPVPSRLAWHRSCAALRPQPRINSTGLTTCCRRWASIGPFSSNFTAAHPRFHDDGLLNRVDDHLPQRLRRTTEADNSVAALGSLLISGLERPDGPYDVLYELAVTQGRWDAAVWISKQLLESARGGVNRELTVSSLVTQNRRLPSTDELMLQSLHARKSGWPELLIPRQGEPHGSYERIDDVLLDDTAKSDPQMHQYLGCIWRSLGLMILACIRDPSLSSGQVKPEILEILALFHHHGLMPESVYRYVPNDRPGVVHQPASLYLLSSRILITLSDAAWKAHERDSLEQARDDDSRKHVQLGSAVRANAETIKPELWLELILWSSLRGGWINAGLDILQAVCEETEPAWHPVSWRRIMKDQLGIERTADFNWDKLLELFSRIRGASQDPSCVQLDRTVSSELINAFVEACVDKAVISDDGDALEPIKATEYIVVLRRFLQRAHLNLHIGNWDAIIARLLDSSPYAISDTDLLTKLVDIAPQLGEEVSSKTKQAKPAHILDSSAALLGLLHRALQVQIDIGSVQGALKIYELIWKTVDDARARSIDDFFRSRTLERLMTAPEYLSDAAPVDHPAFDAQIPLSTTAAFIDLLIDTGSTDVISDLDGTLDAHTILPPKSQWGEPALASVLLRFAAMRGDNEMYLEIARSRDQRLSAATDPVSLLNPAISATLIESIYSMNWAEVNSILEYAETQDMSLLDSKCIAVLGATYLRLVSISDHNNKTQAWQALQQMMTVHLPAARQMSRFKYMEPQTNIVKILSILDKDVCEAAHTSGADEFSGLYTPDVSSVNVVLEAVAFTRGSEAAMRLLYALMPIEHIDGVQPADKRIRDALQNTINIKSSLTPNLATFMIIVRAIVAEKQGLWTSKQQSNLRIIFTLALRAIRRNSIARSSPALVLLEAELRTFPEHLDLMALLNSRRRERHEVQWLLRSGTDEKSITEVGAHHDRT